ncbi:MAG TPA: bifunctional diaminohydroxyphosphoribosylaminopyrimidine deaminase/5-amino-6-(5-phosphoribosylamino)uracil reductase RibD, partial [Thermoanaerobaculia bacterium]|nr:bifunctional diaminohydroxyphosphoribosylaminopyrimidine deaminase/5-amino-6-(5-phosphoribosylamino)uracil reductase RibD [Thermoanaerobaculia bacterium]
MIDPTVLWQSVFELADRGRFSTSPNPRVGALVVADDGQILGEGFHERAGGPHAEVTALRAAGAAAKSATLLVNLEPCASYGRTPPCTDAIIAAGVKRVLCSIEDPDLRTAGRGVRRLLEGGVEVDLGAFAAEARRQNEAFLVSVRERRPFVHVKWAASLDGKIAAAGGASRWISGEEARRDALRLREEHDAILVGAGTVLADDPLLTRRLGLASSVVPYRRIVLDGRLRVGPS